MSKIGTLVLETYYDDMREPKNEKADQINSNSTSSSTRIPVLDLSVDSRFYPNVQQATHTRKYKSLVGAQ